MKYQHTPAPWSLDACASGWMLLANGQNVTAEPFDASDANARLIAAAADLLIALQDLLNATEATYDNRHEREAALDAIAKATGENT